MFTVGFPLQGGHTQKQPISSPFLYIIGSGK